MNGKFFKGKIRRFIFISIIILPFFSVLGGCKAILNFFNTDIDLRLVVDGLTTADLEWGDLELKVTAESDVSAFAYFGDSVAISDNYAIVGAPGENTYDGAAYIFKKIGNSWELQTRLAPTDAELNTRFGISVAISDDYAAVGAPLHSSYEGRIYIFERSDTSWNSYAGNPIPSGDPDASDFFGSSLSISGDYLLAGASEDTYNIADEGAAYMFYRDGTGTWSNVDILAASFSDRGSGDLFGISVHLEGGRAVIGAPGDDSSTGSIYIFEGSGSSWNQSEKLTASDGSAGDEFGISVSLYSNMIAVGSQGADSVYVYQREGAIWTEKAVLASKYTAAGDNFGASVSISGDYVFGAATQESIPTSSGYISVFKYSDGSWKEPNYFNQATIPNDADFGSSVAVRGNSAIVGSPSDDVSGHNEAGSAFYYYRH